MNYFDQLNLIDQVLLSKPAKVKEEYRKIEAIIKSKPSLKWYFFHQLKNPYWFSFLNEQGYFKPENNPKPIERDNGYQISEWYVLSYLEIVSQKTRRFDTELLNIIERVSLYKDDHGNQIDNYRTWWFFVKILTNIPLSKVPKIIFKDVMPVWLTSKFDLSLLGSDLTNDLLPKYLKQSKSTKDIENIEIFVNQLLSIREIKTKESALGKLYEIQTKIDPHWLEESFLTKNNATLIAQKCTNKPIFDLADNVKEIFITKYDKQDYSSIWLRDLTKDDKRPLNDEYFLAVLLRKFAVEKAKYDIQAGQEIVEKFLSDTYPQYLFKRLALVIIADDWRHFSKYFDFILEKKEEYFDIDAFLHELHYLLIKNAKLFTQSQKTKIKTIIEKGPSKHLPDKNLEAYKTHWKQGWFKSLDEIPEFRQEYDKLKSVTGKEVVYKDYDDIGTFREVEDKSPISVEDLLLKSNKEIVSYLNEYKPSGHEVFISSTEGLYNTFKAAVIKDPKKFTEELKIYKIQNYHMLSSLFSGFEDAWKQKTDITWSGILKFTLELIQEDWFWKPPEVTQGHYDYFSWTLSAIGDLIQEGCKTDEWAFDESLHEYVEEITSIMVDKLPYDEKTYKGIGVDHALNSSWGKALTALIYLGLREARLSDKKEEKKESKWSTSLKESYEKALSRNIFEAYTLLGEYLPNLHYIDADWSENKAKNIHTIKDDKIFESFMGGYLFSGNVYDKLYKLLIEAYKRALTIKFEDKRINQNLIQHIAVGYLRGNEELEAESLIDRIISVNNPQYIREIITFMWHQRDYIITQKTDNEKVEKEKAVFKIRIIAFWDYVLGTLSKNKKLSTEEKKVLSELSKLASYLTEIDEISYKRLLASAPYVTLDFDSPYLIEYLNKLKDKGDRDQSAKYVGELFLEMLKGAEELIPDYKWENIVEIVNYLYEIGKSKADIKDLANQICIFYAEKSNLRLRSLYEENNR